ncbi:MAG: ankyrin repeat domain-containing protein [Akkermansia sp.]|nr:ankyrin repeat domain-containing protein [Akkermansia sp.]
MIRTLLTALVLGSALLSPVFAAQPADALNAHIAELKGRTYDDAVLRLYQTRLLTMLPQIRDGADINTTKGNDSGSTALHYACGLGDAELVSTLLACGADAKRKTKKGATAEVCVGSDPGGKIRKLLQNPKTAKLKSGGSAAAPAKGSRADVFNYHISSLKARTYDDAVLRLYQSRLLTMLPLIRDGEVIDTTKGNENGSTALHYACGLGDAELVSTLLAYGADAQKKTKKGATAEVCVGSDPGGKIRKLLLNPKTAKPATPGAVAVAPAPATRDTAAQPAFTKPKADSTPGMAPADITGRTVKIMRSMEMIRDNEQHPDWAPSEDTETTVLKFKAGNTSPALEGADAPPAGYGNELHYVKTGADTATITASLWESSTEYTLIFTSAKGGTVTSHGSGEGYTWETKDATFSIR